jgi:hypothetical protein
MASAVTALISGGLRVERSWLDPMGPRDATILYSPSGATSTAETRALVWDEVSGWRLGRYEGGHQGVRTTLSEVSYLGGGVLLDGKALAGRVRALVSEPRPEYRAFTDLRDGLDDALAGWS